MRAAADPVIAFVMLLAICLSMAMAGAALVLFVGSVLL